MNKKRIIVVSPGRGTYTRETSGYLKSSSTLAKSHINWMDKMRLKKGYKTLNLDSNPTSGYGSTAASCAIIRVHYSTFDGCALAYEGYHYWKDWEN